MYSDSTLMCYLPGPYIYRGERLSEVDLTGSSLHPTDDKL
eukprot:COSAG01_NODE_32934_length_573_cov_0.580169_1_plen_39_part_01